MSEALGIDPDAWGLNEVQGGEQTPPQAPPCRRPTPWPAQWLRRDYQKQQGPVRGWSAAEPRAGRARGGKAEMRLAAPMSPRLPALAALSCPSPATPALPPDFPPTLYVSMLRDEDSVPKIERNADILRDQGTPVEIIEVGRCHPPTQWAVVVSFAMQGACNLHASRAGHLAITP